MNCPVCSVPLQMTERQGVEIDYCSKCRGVWLDRGELDKILERSRGGLAGPEAAPPRDRLPGYAEPHRRRDYDDDDDYRYGRKRKNWLEDLFD
ncbi:MAG: zf-TFIIB domain-containing protein [Actinomycetota bacterium]